jgi:hypothetical protein
VNGSQMGMRIGHVHAEQPGIPFQLVDDAPAAAKFGKTLNALSRQAVALNGRNISTGTKTWIKLQGKRLLISISLRPIPYFNNEAFKI